MASPVAAVRQPLAPRNANTTYYPTPPSSATPAATGGTLTSTKPLQLLSHKRSHSQISGGQENASIQTQILNAAFKTTSPHETKDVTTARQRTTSKTGIPLSHAQAGFKLPPLPRPRTSTTTRQRQETHDPRAQEQPVQEDKEMIEWRRSTKLLFQRSTFYFDACEPHFQEQASALLPKMGAVIYLFAKN
jgi:hypothetical protein